MLSVTWREAPRAGVRLISGSLILDEELRDGRLVTRYWSPAGQIWPEMHLEHRALPVFEPRDSFVLAINGQSLAGGLSWVGGEVDRDPGPYEAPGEVRHAVTRLGHSASGVSVNVHTRLDGSQFLIRWLEITNHSDQHVAITAVAPLAGPIWTHRVEEHLHAGRPTPFELASYHSFVWGQEADFYFEPLSTGVKSVDGDRMGRSGHGRPAFWARDLCNGQTFVCELAWGGNYEFALDCQLDSAQHRAGLYFRMGLSGHDPALRVLAPGESATTPPVHAGLFAADLDAIVQATHDHVRHVVMAYQVAGRETEIEANHRGYLCDRENEEGLKKDAEVAAAVGVELYLIDAGWYGREPNRWFHNAGDWQAGPWLPNGLEPVVAHARELGMRFGLWVEAEAAGANSRLRQERPQWLLRRFGEPIRDGRALDLTQPEVAQWVENEIARIIEQYDLDLFRLDHNHLLTPSGNREVGGFVEDLTWRYYETLYGIFERLRARYPRVVFQNCAGGGGRLDWGTLHRFQHTEISDWHRQARAIKILNNLTLVLPPEYLLRAFGTESSELDLESDLNTQLRLACLARPTLRGVAPSLAELSPRLREAIQHHLKLHREHIRPAMLGGRVFHHTPLLPLFSAHGWCVLEYAGRDRRRAVVAVFRLSEVEEDEFLLRPRGIDPDLRYAVTLDEAGQHFEMAGANLMYKGLQIRRERALSSELVLLSALT